MVTPAYNRGGYRGGWGNGRSWGRGPGPTNNGWFDSVGIWFDGGIPQYAGAGQPASVMVRSGSPVYLPAPPPSPVTDDPATTAPAPSVIVVSRT